MKNVIVTTTINSPTRAIRLFDSNPDWLLIVVGDKKTPRNFNLEKGIYLSPDEQHDLFPSLSNAIGWNCIQRRNIGFLYALSIGAQYVATVDDDNIPSENWGKIHINESKLTKFYKGINGVFDPLAVTNYPQIWHRGFPIQELQNREYETEGNRMESFAIQANFWNGDPDIDAICRMEHAPICEFDPKLFPFSSDAISPFNSQNTILNRSALREYFMFPRVGRMDDIWASWYVQAKGYKVLYDVPTVTQDRNPHDLTIDFEKEVIGYIKNRKLIDQIIYDPNKISDYVGKESWEAFQIYLEISHNINDANIL